MVAMYPEVEPMKSGNQFHSFLFLFFSNQSLMTDEDSILDLIWILKIHFRHNKNNLLYLTIPNSF